MSPQVEALDSPLRIIAVVILGIGLSACGRPSQSVPATSDPWHGATVLIGIDGLRWDSPERFEMGALLDVADGGVRAGSLVPVFPTKTFPNFYALATGLFPNKSGIVDNTMYDPVLDARFRMSDTSKVRDGAWWGGEPIWVTAEKHGKPAAVFFWPGSEAEISGRRPSFWKAYDGSVPNRDRVEQALDWLSLPPARRPELILVYFSAVDEAAHRYGPDAEETARAARGVDAAIGALLSGVANLGLNGDVSFVIVSDHGLAARSSEQVIFLDDYLDMRSAGVLSLGQHVTIWPKPEAVDSVYLALADAHDELRVYKRDDLPARYHLGGHRRTPPIIAVPSPGWTVTTHRSAEEWPGQFSGGAHGYDNLSSDMHGVFIAAGPSFRSNVRLDSLRAVDVYNLVARSIGAVPAPNDGDPSIIPRLMTETPMSNQRGVMP